MKMKIRKILAYTLSVLMALTLVPFVARAGEDVLEENGEKTVIVGEEGEGENGAGTETQVTEVTPTTEEGEQTPEEVVDPTPKEEVEETTKETEEVSKDTTEESVNEVADVPVQKTAAKLKGASGMKGAPALGAVPNGNDSGNDRALDYYDSDLLEFSWSEQEKYYVRANASSAEHPSCVLTYNNDALPSYYTIETEYSSVNDLGVSSSTPPNTPGTYAMTVTAIGQNGEKIAEQIQYKLEYNPNLFTIELDHKDSVGTTRPSGSSYTYQVYYTGMGEYPIAKAGYDGGELPAGYTIVYDYTMYSPSAMSLGSNRPTGAGEYHVKAEIKDSGLTTIKETVFEDGYFVLETRPEYKIIFHRKIYNGTERTKTYTINAKDVFDIESNPPEFDDELARCYTIEGWYKDEDCSAGNKFDFSNKITKDLVNVFGEFHLYANCQHTGLNNELRHTPAVAATCAKGGNVEYWHCIYCFGDFTDANATTGITNVYTQRLSHNLVAHPVKDATCEENGVKKEYYECTLCGNCYPTQEALDSDKIAEATLNSDYIIPALGHDYLAPSYTWNTDNTKVEAIHKCNRQNCTHSVEEEVDTTIKRTEPTCTEAGEVVYTATFTKPDFTTQTKTETLDALDHDWGDTTYSWSADYSTATASRTCKRDKCGLEDSETVDAKEVVTKAPTCTEAGSATYTAIFTNTAFATQTEIATLAALGHNWDKPVYEWAADKSTVTASRKCLNDPTHVETETVNTKYDETKPQTETEAGSGVYTADFTNPAFESQYAYIVNGEDKIVYLNVTEGGLSYTKGSGETLVSRFERSIDNPSTIEHFLGIDIDGSSVSPQNYDTESGSVIIKLKPSYLDTLTPGEHTLKVLFDDGFTTTKFNIVVEEEKTVVVKKEAKKAKTAKTGDATPMMICIIVMIISAAAAVMILIKKNKLAFRK